MIQIEKEFIVATFNPNTRKAIHVFLCINLILPHLQNLKIWHEFMIIAPTSCPTIVLGDLNIHMLITSNDSFSS